MMNGTIQSIKLKYAVQLRGERVEGDGDSRPYVGLEHIESGTGRLTSVAAEDGGGSGETLTGGDSLCNVFKPNDVLFGKLRPYLAKTWVAEFEGRCTTELLVMIPKEYDSTFLKYAFLSDKFIEAVNASTFGVKMPRADWDSIGNQSLFFPPFEHQKVIANFLDKETARIDALVQAKENLLTMLAEKRQALITNAVTRGLDPNVSLKPSGVDWLGDVPEHWEIIRLKYLGEIYYGLSQPPEYQPDGLPLLRATNVFRGVIQKEGLVYVNESDLPESKKVILKEGDIIVVRSGAYTADSAMITKEWEGAVAGFDMVYRTNNKIVPKFLAQILLAPYVLESQLIPMSARAAQPHLNAEELGSVIVAIPPEEEQKQIIEQLYQKLARIEVVQNATEKTITLLRERRSALITAAVTGQIEISHSHAHN